MILYVCFAAAFFSLQISLLHAYAFTILLPILLPLEKSFELTSDQLCLPICAHASVIASKPVRDFPFLWQVCQAPHICPLTS